MRVVFVADGPRDEVVVPAIVEVILELEAGRLRTDLVFIAWKQIRLHGRGFGRKLQYVILRARTDKMDAVVATVDCDDANPRSRLRELVDGRSHDRAKSAPFPTAVGEARPHVEAWLLDDSAAVRCAIQSPEQVQFPSYKQVTDPKAELNRLLREHGLDELDYLEALALIAASLAPERCVHAKETGLKAFVDEVRLELRPQR
jgi:hypothetical protein